MDLTNTSVSGTSNWSNGIINGFYHSFSVYRDLRIGLLSWFHLNPNAGHLKTLVGVWHPVEEAEGKTSSKTSHNNQVVGKEQCSTPDTSLP